MGRIGNIRGNRCGNGNFGGTVYHESGSVFVDVSRDTRGYYECLVEQIIKMFDTGQSPVTSQEMMEVVRFWRRQVKVSPPDGSSIIKRR